MREWSTLPGRLYVISGPSGSGKSTLVRKLLERRDIKARLSVSATTRCQRSGEVDGVDYYFLGREEFERRRDRGEFLEWAEVHGNLYGTPATPVETQLRNGENVILEIDVQGALIVREQVPDAVLIFVKTPTFEALESRLRSRGSETESTMQRRLETARRELEQVAQYDHQLMNEDLDQAVEALTDLLNQSALRGDLDHNAR